MYGIAKVDDSRDSAALVEQHVVEVQIAVDDLAAEARPSRRGALLVAVEDGLDEAAPVAIVERVEVRPELGRLRQVPEQLATRRWMEEAAQGEVQPRVRLAVGPSLRMGEIRAAGAAAAAAVKPLEQPHEVGAVPALDGRAVGRPAR